MMMTHTSSNKTPLHYEVEINWEGVMELEYSGIGDCMMVVAWDLRITNKSGQNHGDHV